MGRIYWAFVGAALVGGVAGALGFVLPVLLTPGANQGPLLGIFVTGPLGAIVGALLGAVCARRLDGGAGKGGP